MQLYLFYVNKLTKFILKWWLVFNQLCFPIIGWKTDMTVNYPLMVKTIWGKFWTQQKSVKLQVFNCVITKKWAHSFVFFKWFCLFFRNIYFKEHLSLTASVCIIVQDWYIFFDIIFYGLHIFSSLLFLLP